MTPDDAAALAARVGATTGHQVRVEYEAEFSEFVVVVDIERPKSGAIREEFRLADEGDWEWLRERITDA